MRRFFIVVLLIVTLVAVFQLSRSAEDWHYVTPVEPGELAYAASFDGPSADWEQTEGRLSAEVSDSALTLSVETTPGLYSASSPYFEDFDVRVTARMFGGVFDGNNENQYGIIFRQRDRDNYYTFGISNDGQYIIERVLDGRTTTMSYWIETPAIRRDRGAVNALRVVGVGDTFQFYVNDELLQLCIPDSPDGISTFDLEGNCMGTMRSTLTDKSISFGRLGVVAALDPNEIEPVVVEFDNVLVYGPHPIEIETGDSQ